MLYFVLLVGVLTSAVDVTRAIFLLFKINQTNPFLSASQMWLLLAFVVIVLLIIIIVPVAKHAENNKDD